MSPERRARLATIVLVTIWQPERAKAREAAFGQAQHDDGRNGEVKELSFRHVHPPSSRPLDRITLSFRQPLTCWATGFSGRVSPTSAMGGNRTLGRSPRGRDLNGVFERKAVHNLPALRVNFNAVV